MRLCTHPRMMTQCFFTNPREQTVRQQPANQRRQLASLAGQLTRQPAMHPARARTPAASHPAIQPPSKQASQPSSQSASLIGWLSG